MLTGESEEFEDLSGLPLIPMPEELKNLPPLSREIEERMRLLARRAIEQLMDKYKTRELLYNNRVFRARGKH